MKQIRANNIMNSELKVDDGSSKDFGNFSMVNEEYNEIKGKSRGFSMEKSMLSNRLVNLFTDINPLTCKNDFLGKKRECPKPENDNINNFNNITKIENNTSKKIKVSNNPVRNCEEQTSPYTFNLKEENVEKKDTKNIFNKDNYIKVALKSPFPFLVGLIENQIGSKLAVVNLQNVFGGTTQNKMSLKWKFYQIICFGEGNKEILEEAKGKNEKIFNYFCSREYKFLLKKCYDNDKHFNIDGKDELIEEFITFEELKKKMIQNVFYLKILKNLIGQFQWFLMILKIMMKDIQKRI